MSQTTDPKTTGPDVSHSSGEASGAKTSAEPRRAGLPSPPGRRIPIATWITLGIGAAFLWAALGLEVSASDLFGLPSKLFNQLQAFFPPDAEYGQTKVLPAALESLQIAWIGTIIGAFLSLPLAFLAARNLAPRTGVIFKTFLAAVRTMPEILLAIYFVPIVGLGAFAGALAVGIHSIGTVGKLSSEVIESMDTRPLEAIRAAGGGRLAELRYGVLPQVLPEILALWLYRFEINLRASAVLGVVGAGGLGGVLLNTLRYRRFEEAGAVLVVTIVAVLLVDMISGAIRRRLTES
ncbi:MAG: phosphonate ABC transporter, permease protein PhnE [Acidobacteriota bacterium]